jgi:hypothetical protein
VSSRVSGGIDWIQEIACELTSTNANFCKSKKGVQNTSCKKSKKGKKPTKRGKPPKRRMNGAA